MTFFLNKYNELFIENTLVKDFLEKKNEPFQSISEESTPLKWSERNKAKESKDANKLKLEIPKQIIEVTNDRANPLNWQSDNNNNLLEFKRQISNSSLNLKDESPLINFNFNKTNSDFTMTPWNKKESSKLFFNFNSVPSYFMEKIEEPEDSKEENSKLSVIEQTPKFEELEKSIMSDKDQN